MQTLLKKYFGYDQFRPLQKEIISHFTQKKDCLVLMPTGGGKSLCFQLPALTFEGLTVVISPLIALMKDQVDSLNEIGIPATFLNSSLSAFEIQTRMRELSENKYKLLYLAPERLGNGTTLECLKKQKISAFAIDEAHCISQWGHDFRPDYRNLSSLKKYFPTCPIIALTASATPQVQSDIMELLNLENPKKFTSSFFRENLSISVLPKQQMKEHIADILSERKGESAIIYCFSRKETEDLANYFCDEGINALPYHAGLENTLRQQTQEKFIRDEVPVITATIAFGMGVDKPNIRTIFHTVFPKTMEGYYQEIGRAGRDGLESECILFFSEGDRQKHDFFIGQTQDQKLQSQERKKMQQMLEFSRQKKCRWNEILEYFSSIPTKYQSVEENKNWTCGKCDVCQGEKNTFDATEVSQKILSAVVRTGNCFGKNYVLKVLKGSKDKKILQNNHENLSVWGIEKKYSLPELLEIFSYLQADKLLEQKGQEYPTYTITPKGIDFLQSRKKIEIPKILIRQKAKVTEDKLEYHQACFERLRSLRKFLADKKRVPPYVIFSDVSLQEMAYYLPTDNENFGKITGVGQKKIEEFAEVFLEEIADVMEEEKLESREIPSRRARSGNSRSTPSSQKKGNISDSRYEKTRKMVMDKNSLREMAEIHGFQEGTIVNHLEKLITNEKITLDDIKYLQPAEEIFSRAKTSFEKLGTGALKPIFEDCDEKISYRDLRLVRLLC